MFLVFHKILWSYSSGMMKSTSYLESIVDRAFSGIEFMNSKRAGPSSRIKLVPDGVSSAQNSRRGKMWLTQTRRRWFSSEPSSSVSSKKWIPKIIFSLWKEESLSAYSACRWSELNVSYWDRRIWEPYNHGLSKLPHVGIPNYVREAVIRYINTFNIRKETTKVRQLG